MNATWCRFQLGPHVSHGLVEGDRVIEVAGSPLGEHRVIGTRHPLGRVKLLPPVMPAILYAASPNYRGYLEGMAGRRGEPPKYPARPEPKLGARHHRHRGRHRRARGVPRPEGKGSSAGLQHAG